LDPLQKSGGGARSLAPFCETAAANGNGELPLFSFEGAIPAIPPEKFKGD